jgi:hypothetical protein
MWNVGICISEGLARVCEEIFGPQKTGGNRRIEKLARFEVSMAWLLKRLVF